MSFGAPGDTLLITTNRASDNSLKKHLHVLVTACEDHTRNVLIVGIESLKPKCDRTVILRPGDHAFITHESYLNYRRVKIVCLDDLIDLINSGSAVVKDPFSLEVLKVIQDGIRRSPLTPIEAIDFYTNFVWPF